MDLNRVFKVCIALFIVLMTNSLVFAADGSGFNSMLRISYDVPQGWEVEENAEGVVLTSSMEVGLVILVPHDYRSLSQLVNDPANRNILDDGVQLKLDNSIETLNDSTVKAWYRGTMGGEFVKVLAIARVFDGARGYTAMMAAPPEKFSERHESVLMSIAKSLTYTHSSNALLTQNFKKKMDPDLALEQSPILVNDPDYPLYKNNIDAFVEMLEFTMSKLSTGSLERFGGRKLLVDEAVKYYPLQPLEIKQMFSRIDQVWERISAQLPYMSETQKVATAQVLLPIFTGNVAGDVISSTEQYDGSRSTFNASQNGSVAVSKNCVYASVPGYSMSTC